MAPRDRGYHSIPLSFNRQAVIASASVTREANTIHALAEVDISKPRGMMKSHFERTGEKPSLTALIVTTLAHVLKDHPQFNAFIKGKRLVILDDVTVNVLVERTIGGEQVPEPLAIQAAQTKGFWQIHREIREAQQRQGGGLGSLSGAGWFQLIPAGLLRWFIRRANTHVGMARRYGKVAVTAVGMHARNPVWFVPHGSTTVLVTVGGICEKPVKDGDGFAFREHLCLTVSFDHNIVDGAPAARFLKQYSEALESGMYFQ